MADSEIHVELLLGRTVRARDGRAIGRVEEIRAETHGGELVVTEYHVGRYAVFERLSALPIGRALLAAVGLGRSEGYRIHWDQLDVSDPSRLRLLCPVEDLAPLDD